MVGNILDIVEVYATQSGLDREEKEDFLDKLEDTVTNKIKIMVDF